MIAVDTNILLYAHRTESPFHDKARAFMKGACESPTPWSLSWNAVHEFLAIATHPRVFDPPTPLAQALLQVNCWFESPTLHMVSETSKSYWETLQDLLRKGNIAGPKVHDARVAALAVYHGCNVLYSADRDFNRFPTLKVRNPLI